MMKKIFSRGKGKEKKKVGSSSSVPRNPPPPPPGFNEPHHINEDHFNFHNYEELEDNDEEAEFRDNNDFDTQPPSDYNDDNDDDKGENIDNQDNNRKRTSNVWKYMKIEVQNESVRCVICKKVFAFKKNSGTGTLTRHLKNKHPGWDDEVDNTQQFLQRDKSGKVELWNYNEERMRNNFADFIVQQELPFNFAETLRFENFVQTSLQPKFRKMSRKTAYKHAYKHYEEETTALKYLFSTLSSRLSLTSDLWTGRGNLSYICVTCHWIDDDFILQKRIIHFVQLDHPHTGSNIANEINNCFMFWNISDKILSITFDNASNNDRAVFLLKSFITTPFQDDFFHIRCVCHILNLVVKDGIEEISTSVEKIRTTLTFIKASGKRLQEYHLYVLNTGKPYKTPYLDVKNRWNSTFRMLKEAEPYADLITTFVNMHYQERYQEDLMSSYDWDLVKTITPILSSFKVATDALSGCHYPTSSLMLSVFVDIVELFCKYRNDDNVGNIIYNMEQKWLKYYSILPPICVIACIFYPRCKFHGCVQFVETYYRSLMETNSKVQTEDDVQAEIAKIQGTIKAILGEYRDRSRNDDHRRHSVSGPRPNVSGGFFSRLSTNKALRSTAADASNAEWFHYVNQRNVVDEENPNFDPLKWWKSQQQNFSILSAIARDLLTVQMSSVASESAFSAGNRVLSDRRSSLSARSTEMCVKYKDWLDNMWRNKEIQRAEETQSVLTYEVETDEEETPFEEEMWNDHTQPFDYAKHAYPYSGQYPYDQPDEHGQPSYYWNYLPD